VLDRTVDWKNWLEEKEVEEAFRAQIGTARGLYNLAKRGTLLSYLEWQFLCREIGYTGLGESLLGADLACSLVVFPFKFAARLAPNEETDTRFRELSFPEFLVAIARLVWLWEGLPTPRRPGRRTPAPWRSST